MDALLHIALHPEGSLRFTDDTPETLTIPGLWYGSYADHDLVMEGPWVLPLGKLGGESRELDVRFLSAREDFTYPAAGAVLRDGTYLSGTVGEYDRYFRVLTACLSTCNWKGKPIFFFLMNMRHPIPEH